MLIFLMFFPLAPDLGAKYLAINKELARLGDELQTDLTTIDGLMWYVSKRLKPILQS